MVLFNDPQRYVATEVYTLLRNNDIIPQLFRHVQVPQGQTREYQFTLAAHNTSPYIAEIWGHKPENVSFADAKARSYIIQKDAQLHREQWINLAGPRGNRKQIIAELFAYSILQGKEEMVFMGAGTGILPTGYQNGFFNLVADASSSIHKPADTCSTGGTADTGSSYTGGARTNIALHVDLSKAFQELKNEGFIARVDGLTGSAKTKHVFLNQLAYEMIYLQPMYNGASYGDSYRKVMDDNKITPVVADIIDSDYAGADDGTTQMVTVPDILDNFVIGVINAPRQEPWAEALGQHGFEYWSKFWLEQVQFAIPKDNGTYYKKAVHVLNITPYNSA
jgi:hypothetical protein